MTLLEATMPIKPKAKDLTDDQKKRLGDAANGTWDEIGGDCLQGKEEMGMKPICSRSEVIELVVDANRLECHLMGGMWATKSEKAKQNADLLAFLKDAEYKEIVKVLKPFFPFAKYGW